MKKAPYAASPQLVRLLEESFKDFFSGMHQPAETVLKVQFYPYTSLKNTIRFKDNGVLVRFSDLLWDAPSEVLDSAFLVLLSKLFRRRPGSETRGRYQDYIAQSHIQDRAQACRSQRGSKRLLPPEGRCHDLAEVFSDLNNRFFDNQVEIRMIGWGRNSGRKVLGHWDPAHDTIVVSRVLDTPKVPRFVVEFIVYHEMLHALQQVPSGGRRRTFHPNSFKEAEKLFPDYQKARKFIAQRWG
jgi:hypothetical protein